MAASINGGCIDAGEGTSFSAPVVSGVVALVLEANPDLTWRDVQAIIAATSTKVNDEEDDTAAINGAGYWHSNYYGFGIINAQKAVQAAEAWESLGDESVLVSESGILNVSIPDYPSQPVVDTLTVSDVGTFMIESVYMYIRIEHSSRGHLQINLTSPSGMQSILSPGNRPENTQLGTNEWWKLSSVRYWGESPEGSWTLSIADLKKGDVEGTCADYDWRLSDMYYCTTLETLQVGMFSFIVFFSFGRHQKVTHNMLAMNTILVL
jgi:subtilisin-like proprotein convertase family protein